MRSVFLRIILLCTLSLSFIPAKASVSNVRFQRLTINDGLSLSSVYCIFQDSRGFMWFGTEDGLNRYDGTNFTVYRPDVENLNSISYKWVEIIFEDSHGNLWFGSRGGLTRFDPSTEKFLQYTSKSDTLYRIPNDTVMAVEQVGNTLIVGTKNGAGSIDLNSGIYSNISLTSVVERQDIVGIVDIDKKEFAIASTRGLFILDKKTLTPKRLLNIEDQGVTINRAQIFNALVYLSTSSGIYLVENFDTENPKVITSTVGIPTEEVYIGKEGTVWLSSDEGLFHIDKSDHLKLVIPCETASHSLAIVRQKKLVKGHDGAIWYATQGEGVYRIDVNNKFDNFRNNPCNTESLSEDAVNTIYCDQTGIIWLGTFGAGICAYSPDQQRFDLIKRDPTSENTLASDFVWTIFEDSKKRVWVGSNDNGISIIDRVSGSFKHLNYTGRPDGLSHSSVRKIYQDSNGLFWFGTDGGGLNSYDEATGKFKVYRNDPNNSESISDNSVRTIYEDFTGAFWIGTRNGLNLMDRENGKFKQFLNDPSDTNSLSHNFVYASMHRDKKDNLWIGTYGGGLNRLDIQSGNFEKFIYNSESPHSISDNIVFSIYEDEKGIFWIGTNAKLNRFDPDTKTFKHYGLAHGLPNEVIYGIVPDESGKLWLSTNLGICRFDPNTEAVVNFDVSDGLQSNEFNGGAFHKGKSGQIYFGGVYGLNILRPEELKIGQDNSIIVFSRIEVLGNEVKVSNSEWKRDRTEVKQDSTGYHLPKHIAYMEEIILAYNHRHFSVEFANLGNIFNNDIEYAFRMVGLDDRWQNTGTRNYVSYANMSPGHYILQVRSKLSDGTWSQKPAALGIVIKPPFWLTWWFIVIEIITLTASALFIYRYLLRLKTYKVLEAQNEQINRANQQLQVSETNLKTLNATKDKFFSIVSHDLKNPFASVLSISEMLKDNYDSFDNDDRKDSVKRVHSSLQHIYSLLENLLTWSRTQTGRIKFNPVTFNLSAVLQEAVNLYSIASCKKNITIEAVFDDDIYAFADRDMIHSVVRNLLNNALKFTPSDKQVKVIAKGNGEMVEVSVKDEGVGMTSETVSKLFKIDEKVKTEGTAGEKGTGLGLIICKEFIEKNKGSLAVNSNLGEGSSFSFKIPAGK